MYFFKGWYKTHTRVGSDAPFSSSVQTSSTKDLTNLSELLFSLQAAEAWDGKIYLLWPADSLYLLPAGSKLSWQLLLFSSVWKDRSTKLAMVTRLTVGLLNLMDLGG